MVEQDDGKTHVDLLSSWHVSRTPKFLQSSSGERHMHRITEACILLQSMSLITISGSGSERMLSMHPLIHDWIWRRQQHGQMETTWAMTGSVLSLSLYEAGIPQAYEQDLALHVQYFIKLRWECGLLPSLDLPHAQIIYRCADALDEARADEMALDSLSEVVHQLRSDSQELSEEDVSLHKLWARSSLRNGDIESSVRIWENVVSSEKELNDDHPSRLASEHALAGAYEV